MGIFEAEARGHAGEEDVLTSRIFGILEILDQTKFLIPILAQCGVKLSQETAFESFVFSYWRETGKRTPDVILEDNQNLIFFENKLSASVGVHQLVEEYADGVKARKNFWLIALTADWTEPPEVQKSKELLVKNGIKNPMIQWINWQKIYAILHSNAKNEDQTEEKLVNDLLSLLETKGLSTFTQFQKRQLDSITDLWPQVPGFLENCSALFGTLSSTLHNKNIIVEDSIRRGSISRVLRDYARWVPHRISIRAWDKNWGERKSRQGLTVLVQLNPLELTVGYHLTFAGQENLYELFIGAAQSCNLGERLLSLDNYSVTHYDGPGFWPIDRIEKDNLNKETFSRKVLGNAWNVIIGRAFDHEEMSSPKLLGKVEKCLVCMRDIINENGLYFAKQAIDSFTPREITETMGDDEEQPLGEHETGGEEI